MRRFPIVAIALVAGISVLAAAAWAQMPVPPDAKRVLSDDYEGTSYSPYAARELGDGEAPSRLLWGDTHLHTAMSMDAGAFGNRLGIAEAYRFARGEEIVSSTGMPARLSRPLDYLVVADHSDNMGFFPDLFAGKPNILGDPERKGVVRPDPGWRGGRGGTRADRSLLPGQVPRGPHVHAGLGALQVGLAGDHRHRGEVQRSGQVHRLHRLRVDLADQGQQHAPGRHLPRRRGARPRRWSPTPPCRRWAARIRAISGSG